MSQSFISKPEDIDLSEDHKWIQIYVHSDDGGSIYTDIKVSDMIQFLEKEDIIRMKEDKK